MLSQLKTILSSCTDSTQELHIEYADFNKSVSQLFSCIGAEDLEQRRHEKQVISHAHLDIGGHIGNYRY